MPKKPKIRPLIDQFSPLFVMGYSLVPLVPRKKEKLDFFKKSVNEYIENVRRHLEHAHKLYEATENPLACWGAFLGIRRRNYVVANIINLSLPKRENLKDELIPEWVLSYFEDVAEKILAPQCAYKDMVKHLGFKSMSGPNPLMKFRNQEIRNYALAIVLREIKEGSDLKSAVNLAALWASAAFEISINTDSVEKWVKDYDKNTRSKERNRPKSNSKKT